MRLYTCCPEQSCGTHAETVAFLKSWQVDPLLGFDEEAGRHYLEFTVPQGRTRHAFLNSVFRRTVGGVVCYCGHWHEPDAEGDVYRVQCESCGRDFSVCMICASEGTGGCPWCSEPQGLSDEPND